MLKKKKKKKKRKLRTYSCAESGITYLNTVLAAVPVQIPPGQRVSIHLHHNYSRYHAAKVKVTDSQHMMDVAGAGRRVELIAVVVNKKVVPRLYG